MSSQRPRPSNRDLDAFRDRVRTFIADNAPPIVAREGCRAPDDAREEALLRAWLGSLYAEGFVGGDWPVEHGGRADHHPLHDRIVSEAILRARAPRPIDQSNLAAHVLLHFGSEPQKVAYLPCIRRGEHVWCQLLSEPDAGSDIAGVRTRGTAHSDGTWTLDGQKIWITDGHWANMGLALVRTDPGSVRHHGLTMFLVPMSADGVDVRPIRTLGDSIEVNEVFLNDVQLPGESVVGEVGQGWSIIMAGLEFERFSIGGNVALLDLLVEDLIMVARHLEVDGGPALQLADIRQQIAELAVEAEVAKAFIDDHVERMIVGADAEGDAAIAKISFAETYHTVAAFGAALASSAISALDENSEVSHARDRLRECWLWSRAYTVSGGSSEVMHNILAKRRLRLPSS
ncbi:acyl-CoA dehydrogenase family protein [Mycobacterium sp. RTGN3]|uniref:acyl-CoA dehydrogenase family protein n=1 Tax=unclassified Mycobacterium TaxID=2642494 RepID=UPI0039AED08E